MMTPLLLALALVGQYPSPQQPQYVPAAAVYSVPAPAYAAPQVVTLGAGQVAPAGPFGQLMGHVGNKLIKHSWPRVQPITATPAPVVQTVYVQVQQPQAVQAPYVVAQPQQQYAPPPVGIPTPPGKVPPPVPYGSPQQQYQQPAPQYNAPKPSEAVPPVPPR
jgi:hypothetical protein